MLCLQDRLFLSEIIFKMSQPPVNFKVKIMMGQIQEELLIEKLWS